MKKTTLRWWPALLILLTDAALLAWKWGFSEAMRQHKVTFTFSTQFLVFLAMVLWLLFFSRLKWGTRLSLTGALILPLAIFFTLFRVREVSGDLLPIFEWRWAERSIHNELTADIQPAETALSSPYDYPQFLGPNRDATISTFRLEPDWQENPPQELWRQPVGEGWSAFAVAGNVAVTHEQRGALETVVAYELHSGRLIWQHADSARYQTVLAGVGPRATPTIREGRVYAIGATGLLSCLELASGRLLWQKNIISENNARRAQYGVSCSPLVVDSLVVVSAGGRPERSLVAYDKDSGRLIWGAGDDRAAYSSPVLWVIAGVPQILIFTQKHVAAHAPESGEILWQFAWPPETEKVAQPRLLPGDRLLISSGYGVGAKMLQIKRNHDGALAPALLWESKSLKAKFANFVFHDGFVYGLDDGILVCVDIDTGERRWKRGRYGHGQMLLVGGILLIQAENGDVALVRAIPDKYEEIVRMPALDGKTWNNPVLAGPHLLLRNNREAVCYKVKIMDSEQF